MKSMVTVTNEVFKCFFLLTQKCFPDPVNDSFKDRESIPSVLLLFITKCIFQYHVSRYEHQNMLCILVKPPSWY